MNRPYEDKESQTRSELLVLLLAVLVFSLILSALEWTPADNQLSHNNQCSTHSPILAYFDWSS